MVTGFGLALLPVGLGLYSRTRVDLVESLWAQAEAAQLRERARIAREMHDVLAHKVSLIALHAGALEVTPDADAARVEEVAGVIRTTAVQALEELRSVLGVLRDGAGAGDVLAPQPDAVDIERLVASSRAAGLDVGYRADVPELPGSIARTAYRLVQEALTNVHKHAPGARTSVVLAGDEQAGVTITVDNEPPREAAPALPGSGSGLAGLHERMRLLGGTLACGPAAGGGWRVDAWLPWSPRPDPVTPVGEAAAT